MEGLTEVLQAMRRIQAQNSKIDTQLEENDAHIRRVHLRLFFLGC